MPKVLGEAVGLSPLLVLVSVTRSGSCSAAGPSCFAVPIAAVLVTLFDVVLRDVDPAEEDVPAVIFSRGKDAGLDRSTLLADRRARS